MKKAWSFFWLVVVAFVAATILLSWITPFMWVIVTLFVLAIIGTIAVVAYRTLSSRRRHF